MVANTAAKQDKKTTLKLAFLVIVSTSAGFFGGWLGANDRPSLRETDTSATRQIVLNESELINKIAEEASNSVVSVSATRLSTIDSFFGPRQLERESAGSGFVIDPKGIIITNRHVVPAGVSKVTVTLSDDTILEDVSVIGRTASNDPLDIAFLKVNDNKGKRLSPLKLGDSGQMDVGHRVVAIGNALGSLQNTVTSGIISGFGRNVQAGDGTSAELLQNLFQTDAAINQGNSGGPLVNIRGEAIGINTAIAGGSAEGIGFAIPINDIKGLIESVLLNGKLQRPYLGVSYLMINDGVAQEFNLNITEGAFIVPAEEGESPSIVPGSPAAEAGLKERDIIIKVGNTKIKGRDTLASVIGSRRVGETIDLTFIRGGQTRSVKVTLEPLPSN